MNALIKCTCATLGLVAMTAAFSENTGPSSALEQALRAAQAAPEQPFRMKVNCTDDKGVRSLLLFPAGAAIWNNEAQVAVPHEQRGQLIQSLLDSGFAGFETHYGGKPGSGRIQAPIIVMCAIEVQVSGQEKASYQDANGERFKPLLALATRLLDLVDPLAADGVRIDSLAQGLEWVRTGKLVPEALSLRVMRLPADKSVAGMIMNIEEGTLGRQTYQPGVEVGEWNLTSLDSASLESTVSALQSNAFTDMPSQLPSIDTWQVQVSVLNHRHGVRARPLGKAVIKERQSEAVAFEKMARELLTLPTGLAESATTTNRLPP